MDASDLGPMVWTDIDRPLLVVPIGSCEQHGPHLPLHTDTIVATELARDLAARRDDCVVAPPIAITASGEHQGFPGTLSIGTDVMSVVVIEFVRSADWAAGTVLVNGHGGNVTAMRLAADTLDQEGHSVLVWWPDVLDGDPHAGYTETSLMLALAPDQVRLDRAVAGPVPAMSDLVREGVLPISRSGVLGDPTGANAADGIRIFAELAEQLARSVADWVG